MMWIHTHGRGVWGDGPSGKKMIARGPEGPEALT